MGYRALFGSDGLDSMTSDSDVVEAQVHRLSDDGYPIIAQPGLLYKNNSLEEAWTPSRKLEDAVARLQRNIADYRKELRFGGGQGPANPPRPTKRSGFTSTPVPRYSGESSWEQYRQVFAAIVFEWLGQRYGSPSAAVPPGWGCSQCRLVDSGVPEGYTGDFVEVPVGTLRFSGAVG